MTTATALVSYDYLSIRKASLSIDRVEIQMTRGLIMITCLSRYTINNIPCCQHVV